MEYNPLKQYGLTLHEDTPDTSTPVAKMLPSAVAYHYANLFLAAPELCRELEEGKDWLGKFVVRFYIAAGDPTYEKMKALYQELDEFQRRLGSQALAKAEGK